ncbi:hypothetical protein AMTR_s00002p00261130 [Amborella trichopoda]|uniref:Alkaline ceramidase n=1 Tax=Amborella trichopoda TaxID=13333 RepID=W1P0B1_AMBTC|nr:hypothetical protein AMTR_s00002p00261130 [Amborella trichopoda]
MNYNSSGFSIMDQEGYIRKVLDLLGWSFLEGLGSWNTLSFLRWSLVDKDYLPPVLWTLVANMLLVNGQMIIEFFNTISNIPCILLAFIGLINALRQRFEKRFSVLHISNIILSIGSMLYHASLQHVQQQSDETPMVWEVLLYMYVLYSPDWHYRSTMPTFLFLYGAAFAILHSQVRFRMGFKVHYALLCLLCVPRMYKYYIYTREASAKRLAHLFVATILLASMCWLLDRSFCEKISKWSVNPQGHALWHREKIKIRRALCMAFSTRRLSGSHLV